MLHNLCTNGFHIIDNYLDDADYQSLRTIAQDMQQDGVFRSAKIGLNIRAQENNAIRSDQICWIDEDNPHPSIRAYLSKSLELAKYLNQHLFLGLAEFETHFASYQPGAFYKKHIDQFATTKTRKISCVYYLNDNWQESCGGSLKLYNKDDELIQEVHPIGNRFIYFNSELPHEVCQTNKARYSITGWMKTRPLSQ